VNLIARFALAEHEAGNGEAAGAGKDGLRREFGGASIGVECSSVVPAIVLSRTRPSSQEMMPTARDGRFHGIDHAVKSGSAEERHHGPIERRFLTKAYSGYHHRERPGLKTRS